MLGLDERIAELPQGASPWVVLAIAALLGLRHATDPDHLAAVATLVANNRNTSARAARKLGLAWGLGHAVALTMLGVPIVLLDAYLPQPLQQAAEAAIALVIVALSARLLLRWRSGYWHSHSHVHEGGLAHSHGHAAHDDAHVHPHSERKARTAVGAFGIGTAHGIGGSAGIGVLLLASIGSRGLALGALMLFAIFTAVSMTLLSSGFGLALAQRPLRPRPSRALPALAVVSLAFGLWYGLAAVALFPPAL